MFHVYLRRICKFLLFDRMFHIGIKKSPQCIVYFKFFILQLLFYFFSSLLKVGSQSPNYYHKKSLFILSIPSIFISYIWRLHCQMQKRYMNTLKNSTKKVLMTQITTMAWSLTYSHTSWSIKSSRPQEALLQIKPSEGDGIQLSYFKF